MVLSFFGCRLRIQSPFLLVGIENTFFIVFFLLVICEEKPVKLSIIIEKIEIEPNLWFFHDFANFWDFWSDFLFLKGFSIGSNAVPIEKNQIFSRFLIFFLCFLESVWLRCLGCHGFGLGIALFTSVNSFLLFESINKYGSYVN